MFLVAQAILGSYGLETPSLPTATRCARVARLGRAWRRCSRCIGLALGFVLRSTAAAIIGVLAVIFGPPFLGVSCRSRGRATRSTTCP